MLRGACSAAVPSCWIFLKAANFTRFAAASSALTSVKSRAVKARSIGALVSGSYSLLNLNWRLSNLSCGTIIALMIDWLRKTSSSCCWPPVSPVHSTRQFLRLGSVACYSALITWPFRSLPPSLTMLQDPRPACAVSWQSTWSQPAPSPKVKTRVSSQCRRAWRTTDCLSPTYPSVRMKTLFFLPEFIACACSRGVRMSVPPWSARNPAI